MLQILTFENIQLMQKGCSRIRYKRHQISGVCDCSEFGLEPDEHIKNIEIKTL
jgi:hypothetical protein